MKRTIAAALCAMTFAASAQAGGPEVPVEPMVMAPVIVEEQAASSSAPTPHLVLGVALIAVLFAAAAPGNN